MPRRLFNTTRSSRVKLDREHFRFEIIDRYLLLLCQYLILLADKDEHTIKKLILMTFKITHKGFVSLVNDDIMLSTEDRVSLIREFNEENIKFRDKMLTFYHIEFKKDKLDRHMYAILNAVNAKGNLTIVKDS